VWRRFVAADSQEEPPMPFEPPAASPDAVKRTLDHVRMGFQVIGFDWKYVYINPAAAAHGRITHEKLIGRTIFEAYPGIEDQTPLIMALRRVMTDRTPMAFENQFTFPDGSAQWFDIRIEPVPEGVCIYSLDISARKAAESAGRCHFDMADARGRRLLSRVFHALVPQRPARS
jgi:PAS domain S-box-containing protein